MKVFDLDRLGRAFGGEYTLGAKDLHSQGLYLVYGTLKGRERNRLVRPGKGYEEIFCAIDGPVLIRTGLGEHLLESRHAIHLHQDDSFYISNPADTAVHYIVAGGTRSWVRS